MLILTNLAELSREKAMKLRALPKVHILFGLMVNGVFYVSGGALYKLSTDYSATLIRDGVTPLAHMSFARMGDRVFLCKRACKKGAITSLGDEAGVSLMQKALTAADCFQIRLSGLCLWHFRAACGLYRIIFFGFPSRMIRTRMIFLKIF